MSEYKVRVLSGPWDSAYPTEWELVAHHPHLPPYPGYIAKEATKDMDITCGWCDCENEALVQVIDQDGKETRWRVTSERKIVYIEKEVVQMLAANETVVQNHVAEKIKANTKCLKSTGPSAGASR